MKSSQEEFSAGVRGSTTSAVDSADHCRFGLARRTIAGMSALLCVGPVSPRRAPFHLFLLFLAISSASSVLFASSIPSQNHPYLDNSTEFHQQILLLHSLLPA